MNFDYTFKDGVTVPLKIVLSTYEESTVSGNKTDIRRVVQVNAYKQDYSLDDGVSTSLDSSEILQSAALIEAVFRRLKETSSEEFLATPNIGIKYCPPKEVK